MFLVLVISLTLTLPTGVMAKPPTLPINADTLDGYNATYFTGQITAEASARTAADASLDSRLTSVEAYEIRITALEGQLSAALDLIAELQTAVAALDPNGELVDLANYVTVDDSTINGLAGPHVIFHDANVHVQNGTGYGWDTNGLGNLVLGYNEIVVADPANRTGSHNLIIGYGHEYISYEGFVAGVNNKISAPHASVSGGIYNEASASQSTVSGGRDNEARGLMSSVSGGERNLADADYSWIGGGRDNVITGEHSSISGGIYNTASGPDSTINGGWLNSVSGTISTVSGGFQNTASGLTSSVSGGTLNEARGFNSSVSGGQANIASGNTSSISGGAGNTASGPQSSVSGGHFNTASENGSSVSGGYENTAAHYRSTVSGGFSISTTSSYQHLP